jgi:hypothetical protein
VDIKHCWFIVVVLLLAGCVAPAAPAPPTAPEQGTGAAVCNYPRLHALATSQVQSVATDRARLDAIAAQFDAVTLGISTDRWLVAGTGLTVPQYLARANPAMQRWVYIPAGFAWAGGFDCRNHPVICGWQNVIKDSDWMRQPSGEYAVIGTANNRFLNPLSGAFGRIGAYWAAWLPTSGFTGIHGDVRTTTVDQYGGHVDLDRNGVSDRIEHGLPWLDGHWIAGHVEWLDAFPPGTQHVGNGSWQPGGEAYQPYQTAAFVELAHRWRNPASGAWGPPYAEQLRWQLQQLQGWPGSQIIASKTLSNHFYWSNFWPRHDDAVRVALALALLTGGELVLESPISPGWCDECGVVSGFTSRAARSSDWLGCPMADARCAGDLCWRQFEGGMVFLNLGPQPLQVSPPAGYRTIRGWYDTAVNHGGAWDGVLPGHNARVLWRTGPAPQPTVTPPLPTVTPTATSTPIPPTATPTATSTPIPPTPTPTATPTLSIDQRLDRIDQRLDALETRVP